MNKIRREVEVRGADIERAVNEGLAKLGIGRSEAIVEVVDEGSRGLLGLGSRDAIVVVKEITPTGDPEPEPKPEPVPAPPPKRVEKPKTVASAPVVEKEATVPAPEMPKPETLKPEVIETAVSTPSPTNANNTAEDDPNHLENEQAMAIEIVSGMLQRMQVDCEVTATVSEPDDLTGKRMNIINVSGEDLGVLIGPRGDTLSSLQYITRLMTGHKLRQRSNFVVDIEGYRTRREQALRRLAQRMADKVVKRGRAMTLEPMPPNERRIIHMTLREHQAVNTHSVGEGDRRKVRIALKNS